VRIAYSGTTLAADGFLAPPRDLGLNGQQLVQTVQLPRALYTLFLSRGNRSVDFTFTVERFFDTAADAAYFELTHQNDLPDTGLFIVQCADDDDPSLNLRLTGPAFQGVSFAAGSLKGQSLLVSYHFVGSVFLPTTISISPGADPESTYYPELGVTVKKNYLTLLAGATSAAITFASPYEGSPQVYVELIPVSGQPIVGRALRGQATNTGFIVDFAAPLPVDGYVLSWIAFGT
jgi:hypothetical protein